ncbi:hypothetical protein JOM56_009618 [Amanita muscaria]
MYHSQNMLWRDLPVNHNRHGSGCLSINPLPFADSIQLLFLTWGKALSMSAQMPKSSCFFRKLCKTRNKSREKGTSQTQPARDGRNPEISITAPISTTPRPQPVDHSPGNERRLTIAGPHFIDKDARDERNSDISIPAQASTTPRPQPFDHSPGDEGHPGVPVPPRGPPTTSEPPILGDRDAPKVARDSELGIMITSPAISPSHLQRRDEDDNGIPNPIQTLFISSEHSSIDREGEDVQIGEAAHGVDTDLSISKEVPSIITDKVDRVVQRGEAPSISMIPGASNTSKSPTQKPTGVHFGSAHFEGGGHAFGDQSVVHNTFVSGDGQFTDVQRNLICDYIAILAVLPDIKDSLKTHILVGAPVL